VKIEVKQNNQILERQIDSVNVCHETTENPYICSRSSNFTFEQQKILENLYEKMEKCGLETYNMIGMVDGLVKLAELPVYCNNRSCTEEGCKEHRGYLYKRNHLPQINSLRNGIEKPKAYVFTGYNIEYKTHDIENIRKFCRSRMVYLYRLLSDLSRTEFSVHMELKLYPKGHEKYGKAWLHFHVVSGYIDVHKARSRWKRVVKYEQALKFENIERYISKYASKVPFFQESDDRDFYHLVVYKTQMHRYSMALKDCEKINRQQNWYLEDLLEKELFNSYKREAEREDSFTPYYENFKNKLNQDRPPPETDIPACVYVYPKFRKRKTAKTKKIIEPVYKNRLPVADKKYPKCYICRNPYCMSPNFIGNIRIAENKTGHISYTKICKDCGGECID